MSAIIPETFQTSDFVAWLCHFECCTNTNNWDAAAKLRKLPAFLRGPAAAYFQSLADVQKDTYAHLVKFLRDRLCPVVDRERFYAEFESRHLRPNEDPSLFLWALEDILLKADPDLNDAAKQALLGRQFLRGLPKEMKLRLLEHDPSPSSRPWLNSCNAFMQFMSQTTKDVQSFSKSQIICTLIPSF